MRKWCVRLVVIVSTVTAVALTACKNENVPPAASSSQATAPSVDAPPKPTEKVKPAPGTGNVQGSVLYNGKPVENTEVQLCETFNRFAGGASGKVHTARTDADGVFVITNVPPKSYEALLVRVFETDSYVFATSGIGISSESYEVVADQTLFVEPTHLFKSDLKVEAPTAGAKVAGQDLELKWQPYPDAAFYRFSIHPEDFTVSSPYINERVDGTSFRLDKPLAKGIYRWQVTAFNKDDQKLAESADDVKFTVTE